MAVLLIGSPCTLGLPTPTAIMLGTDRGAEQEILIKSVERLQTVHRIEPVIFDKTGTPTRGELMITEVVGADPAETAAVLQLVAEEWGAEHPLGEAIVAKTQEEPMAVATSAGFRGIPRLWGAVAGRWNIGAAGQAVISVRSSHRAQRPGKRGRAASPDRLDTDAGGRRRTIPLYRDTAQSDIAGTAVAFSSPSLATNSLCL